MENKASRIGGAIFAAVAVLHLLRIVCPFEVVIAGYHVPEIVSPIAFFFLGLLAAWLLRGEDVQASPKIEG